MYYCVAPLIAKKNQIAFLCKNDFSFITRTPMIHKQPISKQIALKLSGYGSEGPLSNMLLICSSMSVMGMLVTDSYSIYLG